MNSEFKDYNDFVRYLNNTICMYEGRPVYVKTTTLINQVQIQYIGKDEKRQTVDCLSDKFQPYPFELGLLNIKDRGVTFVSRSGLRHSNYGLLFSSINFDNCDDVMDGQSTISFLFNNSFNDCLMNEYPSFEEALKIVKTEAISVAFNKYYYLSCYEKHDSDCIGITFMNTGKPFAILDQNQKFKVLIDTKRNRTFFSIACKSQIIPYQYKD